MCDVKKTTMIQLIVLLLLSVFLFAACATTGGPSHDPTSFLVDKGEMGPIPTSCKAAYQSAVIKVAVVNFTNNTTFDYATMVQTNIQGTSQRTRVGGAAAGATPGGVGVVWGEREKRQFQTDGQRIQREINAKLSDSVEDGVMNEFVNMGGMKVYTRTEMKKVLEEQKFQASGLVNDTQLVQLGKIAGIKYIVTGSVNNVNLSYKTFQSARKGLSDNLGIVGSVIAAGVETQEGWHIGTDIALRIIDVETGEILFSKVVSGKHIIGKTPYPNYDALIGGIKKAAAKALEDTRPELSKWFTVRGYIMQTRTSPSGSERSALINIGTKQGIKSGSKLVVYIFQEIKDPFTSKSTCDMVKIPVTLEVTDQIQDEKAWVMVQGDSSAIKRVKVGGLVERVPMEGQGFFKKLGY